VAEEIRFLGGTAPQLAYTVPGTAVVTPLSAYAVFDGSGAAGDFVACLSFFSQTGELLSRVPTSTVTAGDTANVTWAPFLRSAQAATPPPTALAIRWMWAYVETTIPSTTNVTGGTILNVGGPGGHYATNDSSLYTIENDGSGHYGIIAHEVGSYLVWLSANIIPADTSASATYMAWINTRGFADDVTIVSQYQVSNIKPPGAPTSETLTPFTVNIYEQDSSHLSPPYQPWSLRAGQNSSDNNAFCAGTAFAFKIDDTPFFDLYH
jgi:hypothetical protein